MVFPSARYFAPIFVEIVEGSKKLLMKG